MIRLYKVRYLDRLREAVTDRVKAIIVVHLYGLPYNMKPIMEIAEEGGLKVIEDAYQAHCAEYHDKRAGSLVDVGVFSFCPTKNMTTGEGGMIITADSEVAKKARMIRNMGRARGRFIPSPDTTTG